VSHGDKIVGTVTSQISRPVLDVCSLCQILREGKKYGRTIINDALRKMRNEAVVDYFNVLSQTSLPETDENKTSQPI